MVEVKASLITPQMAAKWLEANTENRPLRRATVEGLKAAFARGEYVMTHQGIAFDTSGRLIDGQHRLTAIAEMPDTFRVSMMVARNVDPKAFGVVDIGVKRTPSDVLRVPQGLAAVARFLATVVETRRNTITPTLLVPYVSGVAHAYDDLTGYTPTITKTWASSMVKAAAILRMLSGGDRDYILLSYHALNHAEFDAMSRVVQALYRQHVSGKVRGSMDLFARCYRAFDIGRARLDTIQISDHSVVIAEARDVIQRCVLGQKMAGTKPAERVNSRKSTKAAA